MIHVTVEVDDIHDDGWFPSFDVLPRIGETIILRQKREPGKFGTVVDGRQKITVRVVDIVHECECGGDRRTNIIIYTSPRLEE